MVIVGPHIDLRPTPLASPAGVDVDDLPVLIPRPPPVTMPMHPRPANVDVDERPEDEGPDPIPFIAVMTPLVMFPAIPVVAFIASVPPVSPETLQVALLNSW